jgi:hypothetical protein
LHPQNQATNARGSVDTDDPHQNCNRKRKLRSVEDYTLARKK